MRWTLTPTIWQNWSQAGTEERHPRRPLHRWWRSGSVHWPAWNQAGFQSGADQRRAADHGEVAEQSRRHTDRGAERHPRPAPRIRIAQRSSRSLALPFYGYNRPGAKVSQGVIDSFWLQGMMGGLKGLYDCIKAFSETDFREDLKQIDVPTLVLQGDDDQIVPFPDASPLTAKLVKGSVLKGLSRRSARYVHHAERQGQRGLVRTVR
jgi:pimeloyl-ACP methyl ester carboxylesterase